MQIISSKSSVERMIKKCHFVLRWEVLLVFGESVVYLFWFIIMIGF